MSVWWLAIDLRCSSYQELKHRKVVAQGWAALGDLTGLCPLVGAGNEPEFKQAVACLETIAHGGATHAARVMWDLLRIQRGDLVVGIEGITVKGICQLQNNGWESYRLFFPDVYEYANTIGFPVDWVDWNLAALGPPPTSPAQGVQGVAGLRNQAQQLERLWQQIKPQQP